MADVFVSYSRRDTEFVARLAGELRERGKEVWVDVEGIRDAEVFPAALRRAIEASDAFVFVISPDSVTSEFCAQEVAHAAELNKRIVPLALHDVPDEQIPGEIRFRNWIPVRTDGDVGTERVIGAIDTDLGWERQHTRMTVKALEWDSAGRDGSFLLRGSDLAAAEQWLAQGAGKDPGPTELEQEYLLAARQGASRRQRTLVGASLTVAVVAIGLLVFALISRGQAVTAKTDAQAQALAAESEVQQSVDPERAVLLAIAAVRAKPTYGSLGTMFALRAALDASTIRYRLPLAPVQACGGPSLSYDSAPASNVLAEGLCDGTLVLANATTGQVERRVHLAGGPAIGLQYTGNGSALVVSAGIRLLELDPVTGRLRRAAPPVRGFFRFAVDPRAPVVAIEFVQGSPLEPPHTVFDYWNLSTGRLTVTHPRALGPINGVNSFTYTPDGRELVVTATPGPNVPGPGLIVYDIAAQRVVATEPIAASAVAFSPSGQEIALGESLLSGGGRIVMLHAHTLAVDPRFAPISAPGVSPTALTFSPDGTQLAYGFADGTAGLVSAETGQSIDSYLGDTAAITGVSFKPDGRLVATASSDGAIRASRAGGLALRHVTASHVNGDVEPAPGGFVSMNDGPGRGVTVQSWADDGRPLAPPLVISSTPTVDASFLSPGGRFAVLIPAPPNFGPATGQLDLWSVAERRVVRTVRLSQIPSGQEPELSADGAFAVMSVQQGPNSSPELVLVDLRSGRERVLPANAAGCTTTWDGFAFTSDDRYVAAGTFCGKVSLFDVASGRQVGRTLNLGGQLAWSSFSPDGHYLAMASWDGTIKVSPVPFTGHMVTLTENTKGVPQVSWSPDGRYLASASLDHTVRIFDARSLAELRVIAQPDAVNGVAFTADSRDVISSDTGSNIWLWDACTECENPRGLLALARSRVTRSLTAAEQSEFGVT